jgi:probable rRNA maturation factor
MPDLDLHVSIRAAWRARGRTELIRRAADAAIAQAESAPCPLQALIRLTGDEELHRLNKSFRKQDKPTDVLSFATEQWLDGRLSTHAQVIDGVLPIGENYISMPRCIAQAHEYGHSTDDELRLLVIHGVLHLLGFDHLSAARKRAMWAAQDRAFAVLGIANPLRPD